jgi:uncharacterized membrane protein YqjE
MAVPALLAVAALMLVPGLWGLAVLTGLDVWGHARSNVTSVAMAMLAAWLIAASLFFGAWHFRRQARQAKAKPTPRSPQR